MAQGSWFAAMLVMRGVVVPGGGDHTLCERQLRLIRAVDADAAYLRALDLGAAAEHAYEAEPGETIVWTFAGLAELQRVLEDQIEDGVEVFSMFTTESPASLVQPREKLAAFREQRSGPLTARELLP